MNTTISVPAAAAAPTASQMLAQIRINWGLLDAANALPTDIRPEGDPSDWLILEALFELSSVTEGHLLLVQEQLRKSRDQRLARNKVKGRENHVTATDVNSARRVLSKRALPTPVEMQTEVHDPEAAGLTTLLAADDEGGLSVTSTELRSRKRSRSPCEDQYDHTVFERLSQIAKTSDETFLSDAETESPEGTGADHTKLASSLVDDQPSVDKQSRKRSRSQVETDEENPESSRHSKMPKKSGESTHSVASHENLEGIGGDHTKFASSIISNMFDSPGFVASTPKGPTIQESPDFRASLTSFPTPSILYTEPGGVPHYIQGMESEIQQQPSVTPTISAGAQETYGTLGNAQTGTKETSSVAQPKVAVAMPESLVFDPSKYISVDPDVIRYGTIEDQILLLELRNASLDTLQKAMEAQIVNEKAHIQYKIAELKIKRRIQEQRAAATE